ncbi:hypothetical protein ACWGDX_13280 [Streptomyces sp. NPDC055025]
MDLTYPTPTPTLSPADIAAHEASSYVRRSAVVSADPFADELLHRARNPRSATVVASDNDVQREDEALRRARAPRSVVLSSEGGSSSEGESTRREDEELRRFRGPRSAVGSRSVAVAA